MTLSPSRSPTAFQTGIARRLAEGGAAVVVNGRGRERVAAAVDELRTAVPDAEVTGIAADLTSAADCERLVDELPAVDVLVHNAGTPEPRPFFELSDADWERQFALHVLGPVRLCRHYARGMVERGWGRILFNASVTGGYQSGEMPHYGATKAAVLGLSRALAESLPASGVTVNAFIPGPTREEPDPEREAEVFEVLSTSVIQRFVAPSEVGDAVLFLASEHAAAITGATLRVDGGIVRFVV